MDSPNLHDPAAILVVEDDDLVCSFYKTALCQEGYAVETATDYATADEKMTRGAFDVVFTDIRLPDSDGICLLRKIKKVRPETLVVIMTGHPTVDTASSAVRTGAYDYLAKPVNRETLLQTARRAVETRRLQAEKRRLEEENRTYRENLERLVSERTHELLKSQQRYTLATTAGKVGVWDWDLRTDTFYVDPGIKALLGYAEHEIPDQFEAWGRQILAEGPEKVGDTSRAFLGRQDGHYEETRKMRHRDGSIRWFLGHGTAVRDHNGGIYRLVGTYSDITSRVKAVNELKRSNAILEAVRFVADVFLHSPIWEENINRVLFRLGKAAEVSRVYIFENFEDDNGALYFRQCYEWVEDGIEPKIDNPQLEHLYYQEDGFGRWERLLRQGRVVKGNVSDFPEPEKNLLAGQDIRSIIAVPIFMENEWWGFIGFDECLAVREWSQPEIEALKLSASTLGAALWSARQYAERSRFVTAIEQSTDCILITDPRGVVQYTNPAFASVTGYSRMETVGKDFRELEADNLDEAVRGEIDDAVARGNVWRGSLAGSQKDGSILLAETTISPVKDREGDVTNYVVIKRDVTEQMRLRSIAEASNLMENIGYVFSGIRHEIGNPVNSLKMAISILKDSLDVFDRETMASFLQRCMNEITRIEYLLDVLRNYNMFERPRVEPTEIEPFMKGLLSLVSKDLIKDGIAVEMTASFQGITALVDPRALQQVMLNLITNSVDALEGRENARIDFDLDEIRGQILLKVIDNGDGMSRQQQEDLFKPFFTFKAGGTGLGLVIVKKMLAEMDCGIEIESRKGVGTTVTLFLPKG